MRKFITAVFAVCLAFSLTACGGDSYNDSFSSSGSYNTFDVVTENAVANSSDVVYEDDYESEGNAEDSAKDLESEGDEALNQEKYVYTADISMQTKDYDEITEKVDELIEKYKCIVEYEYESDNNYYTYENYDSDPSDMKLDLRIRVPSEEFSTFIGELSDCGKVISKTQNVENITRRYNDTSEEIAALEIELSRLQEFMKQATNVTELLSIEERITNVEATLNQYKNAKADMDTDVKMSTVSLTVSEVENYSSPVSKSTFAERLMDTIKNAVSGFLCTLEDILFICIWLLPYAVIAILVLCIIWRHRRKRLNGTNSRKFMSSVNENPAGEEQEKEHAKNNESENRN